MKWYVIFLVFGCNQIFLQFIAITNAAPMFPGMADSAMRLVDAASDDIASIAVAKAAAVGFAGGVAINSVSNILPNVTLIYKSVADGTDVAMKSTYEAGENTWKYVKDASTDAANSVGENVNAIRNTDPIQVINDTESAMLLKNEALLKVIFNAKRNALLALQDLSENTADFTSSAWNTTNLNAHLWLNSTSTQWEAINAGFQTFWSNAFENISAAITNAQSSLQASKETLADVYSNITLANALSVANITLINVHNTATGVGNTISDGVTGVGNTISDGFGATITITGNATTSALNSLVEAKSSIHDAAENFDSKKTIKNTKKQIGNVIANTIEGAGNLLEQAGVYDAIDTIVHGFAGMPLKMNIVLDQAQDTIVNSTAVAFRSIWEDDESTNEDDLLRNDPQAERELEKENEQEYEDTNEQINDNIDYEIQSIEDEVEKIEKHNYPEETESEDQIETKNKEILEKIMATIINENNEIVR